MKSDTHFPRSWRELSGPARSPRDCAAGFQPAVSPTSKSAARGHFGSYGIDASSADWKSATPACLAAGRQQTGSLRYALARTCERLANSARSWSAVVLYRFSWARGLGVRQPLVKDCTSAMPKRQRTGALHDAGARPQAPFSLTPRFRGVMGGRDSNSTVLTVHIVRSPSALGNPRGCAAGFQPAVSPTSSRQRADILDATELTPALRIGNPRHSRLEVCGTHGRELASVSRTPRGLGVR